MAAKSGIAKKRGPEKTFRAPTAMPPRTNRGNGVFAAAGLQRTNPQSRLLRRARGKSPLSLIRAVC